MAEKESKEEVKKVVKEKPVKKIGRKDVPKWKLEKITEVQAVLKSKPVVGIISLQSLPSAQFQEIKKTMRGKAEMYVARKMIIERALDGLKDEALLKLRPHIEGPIGIILSEQDPFLLCKQLKLARTKTFAKPGFVVEKEIIVPEGETDLPAGPVLSDFKQVKIDARLDKGKIIIHSDSTVAKPGDVITENIASVLAKLDIKPVTVGIDVRAIVEKGILYTGDVLDIDEEQFMQDLHGACSSALNLSVEIGYINVQTLPILIGKAVRSAEALADEAGILTSSNVERVLAKANAQAKAVAALAPESAKAPTEKPKEEKAEVAKPEAKKEEVKEEKKAE